MGIKAVCEEVIALAIADEQNAFRHQRSLRLSTWARLTLTSKAKAGPKSLWAKKINESALALECAAFPRFSMSTKPYKS